MYRDRHSKISAGHGMMVLFFECHVFCSYEVMFADELD